MDLGRRAGWSPALLAEAQVDVAAGGEQCASRADRLVFGGGLALEPGRLVDADGVGVEPALDVDDGQERFRRNSGGAALGQG